MTEGRSEVEYLSAGHHFLRLLIEGDTLAVRAAALAMMVAMECW